MTFVLKIVAILIVATACSQKMNLQAPTDAQNEGSMKITILSQETAVADGFAELTVQVLVQDLLGNVVTNYKPTIQLKNALGVNYSECALTGSDGKTSCQFRATLEGIKEVVIGNRAVEIEFIDSPISKANMFSIVSSSQSGVSAGSDSINSSVGVSFDGPRQEMSPWFLRTDIAIRY